MLLLAGAVVGMLILTWDEFWRVAGVLLALVAAVIAVYACDTLIRPWTLRLSDEGLTFTMLWQRISIRWSDIEGFYAVPMTMWSPDIKLGTVVGMTLSELYDGPLPGLAGVLNRLTRGLDLRVFDRYSTQVPDTYGLGGEQLAELLEHRRRRARDDSRPTARDKPGGQ